MGNWRDTCKMIDRPRVHGRDRVTSSDRRLQALSANSIKRYLGREITRPTMTASGSESNLM
jgi:hypothetical protein